MKLHVKLLGGATALATFFVPSDGWASSHREAPFITKNPKVDGTDVYAFNSYQPGRDGYVTLLANYIPFQDPTGGPNFFTMDPDALYEIHIDNNGDAKEDITFQFDFAQMLANGSGITLPIGPAGDTQNVAVPYIAVAPISATEDAGQNLFETYTVDVVRGDRRTGKSQSIAAVAGGTTFRKPLDNIGLKTLPDYDTYAAAFIYDVTIPGCTPPNGTNARLFVGQRKESFSVNVGQIFDLFNLQPSGTGGNVANILGAQFQGFDDLVSKNITTLALEVPASCLTTDAQHPTIGVWSTASVRQARVINPTPTFDNPTREGGPWAQISRLGNPLINEVIIGLKDKDKFNSSEPQNDKQFAVYVTNPTLPEVIELLFGGAGVRAPDLFPRADLVATFLTGIPGVNENGATGEMLRLNTSVPPTSRSAQNTLGAATCFDPATADTNAQLNLSRAGCDPAGFPNGRRPGDDVTDIEIRVAMGFLLATTVAPSGQLPFVDGAGTNALVFEDAFPYLRSPKPGAPQVPPPGDPVPASDAGDLQ